MGRFRIARRSFLKGAGISILLPMLDVMSRPGRASAGPTISPRFAAFFPSLGMWGHGYDPSKNDGSRYYGQGPDDARLGTGSWRPAQAGALSGPLPIHLQPFESLRQKMMIVSGLSTLPNDVDGTDVNHSLATTCWLTSAWKTSEQATATTANTPPDSVDQAIANAMGITPGSTIVFNPTSFDGTEVEGGHAGYVSSNSKLGGNHLVPKVGDPLKVFNQLFGKCMAGSTAPASDTDDKSILDHVMTSTAALQKKLGKDDSARLDSYLQNIRDVEKNLTAAAPSLCPSAPTYDPALSGGGLDWLAKMRMMVDVTALAMASDAMPIATIMTDTEANGESAYSARVAYASDFVGLGGQKISYHSSALDTHFDIVHAATDESNVQAIEEWFAYTRVLMNLAQRLALKLDSMPVEPNGNTPLDNSILLIGAAHSHSADHKTHCLPTILLGGKNLQMHQGQHVAFPMNTDMGNFYYTMLSAMQVAGTDFNGNSTVLPGLFG